jgi:hypothetical protein
MFVGRYSKLSLLVVLCLLISIPLTAQGRRGGPDPSAGQQIVTPPQTITVQGSVTALDLQYGEGYPNITLSAGGVTYQIFTGPLWYLDSSDFELRVNDSVSATIFKDRLSGDVWVASLLVNNTMVQSLTLRDASGFPLWIRNGNFGHSGFGGNGSRQSSRVRQGQGAAALRAGQALMDLATLDVYVGTVSEVNIAAGDTHPAIEVSLGSSTVVFCLAPYRYLVQIGFAVKVGDSVVVKAADCPQDAGEYVVFSISVNGVMYELRAENGTPGWYFGGRQ